MQKEYESRIIKEAEYLLATGSTIRAASKIFGISKSTLHADITYKLKDIDYELFNKIHSLMVYHFSVRHIRGGEATKKKYEGLKINK